MPPRYAIVNRPVSPPRLKPFYEDISEAALALLAARKTSENPESIVLVEIDDSSGTSRDISIRAVEP